VVIEPKVVTPAPITVSPVAPKAPKVVVVPQPKPVVTEPKVVTPAPITVSPKKPKAPKVVVVPQPKPVVTKPVVVTPAPITVSPVAPSVIPRNVVNPIPPNSRVANTTNIWVYNEAPKCCGKK
jgi:integrin beta 3